MKTKDKIIYIFFMDLIWLAIGLAFLNDWKTVLIGIFNMNIGVFYGIYLFKDNKTIADQRKLILEYMELFNEILADYKKKNETNKKTRRSTTTD